MSRLAGKVALITGAPKGIGTATRQRIGRGRGVGRSHLRLRPEQHRAVFTAITASGARSLFPKRKPVERRFK